MRKTDSKCTDEIRVEKALGTPQVTRTIELCPHENREEGRQVQLTEHENIVESGNEKEKVRPQQAQPWKLVGSFFGGIDAHVFSGGPLSSHESNP